MSVQLQMAAFKRGASIIGDIILHQTTEQTSSGVPNRRSINIIEAKNLKTQGAKSGISDVFLLIFKKSYSCLCLEFKTPVGKQSDKQIEFERQAENKYAVADL